MPRENPFHPFSPVSHIPYCLRLPIRPVNHFKCLFFQCSCHTHSHPPRHSLIHPSVHKFYLGPPVIGVSKVTNALTRLPKPQITSYESNLVFCLQNQILPSLYANISLITGFPFGRRLLLINSLKLNYHCSPGLCLIKLIGFMKSTSHVPASRTLAFSSTYSPFRANVAVSTQLLRSTTCSNALPSQCHD